MTTVADFELQRLQVELTDRQHLARPYAYTHQSLDNNFLAVNGGTDSDTAIANGTIDQRSWFKDDTAAATGYDYRVGDYYDPARVTVEIATGTGADTFPANVIYEGTIALKYDVTSVTDKVSFLRVNMSGGSVTNILKIPIYRTGTSFYDNREYTQRFVSASATLSFTLENSTGATGNCAVDTKAVFITLRPKEDHDINGRWKNYIPSSLVHIP